MNVVKNIVIDIYGLIMINNSFDVKMKIDNVIEKLIKIVFIEKKDVFKVNVNGLVVVENLVKEIYSNGFEVFVLFIGNVDVVIVVFDKFSLVEEFKN